jgi:hypothetical protein
LYRLLKVGGFSHFVDFAGLGPKTLPGVEAGLSALRRGAYNQTT